jgi:subtilisin family serine protease
VKRSRIAAGVTAAALLVVPVIPATADDLPTPAVTEEVPAAEIPTLGADIPATEPPSTEVSAVVRTDDGSLEVATAADHETLTEQTAGESVVAVDAARKTYAMALPANADAGRDLQWGLNRLQAEDLWQRSIGNGITVAVLDTGVKASHPDLKGKVAKGYDAIASKPGARFDDNGHGTFLAGIIVGKHNGSGVAGIAPGARILPVKVLNSDGVGDSDDIARGIIWAVDNGADVINMSFGADSTNKVEAAAIDYARGSGVTLIAAAGNEGFREVMYPAAYPGVVGVGATDPQNQRASFSNRGGHVDVVAPGQGILSTFTDIPYTWTSGTSMSTAYVSGIAALAMSYSPGAGGEPLGQQISASATDLGAAGPDADFGSGLVDPASLLEQLGAGRAPGMPRDLVANGAGDTLTVSFTPGVNVPYVVRLKAGLKGPASATNGKSVGRGVGNGQPVTLTVPKRSAKKAYAFGVFTTGPTGTSKAVATVRPATWALTDSQSVPRNSRQKVQIGVKVAKFGWIGGHPIQLTTSEGGGEQRVRRFIPVSGGPDSFTIRKIRWNFNYQATLLAPGFWNPAQPQESQWVQTTITAKRGGAITGRVTPSKVASEVQLQRRAGASWKTIATTQTKPNGKYQLPGKAGDLRVYSPADAWHGPASREL